MYLDTEIVKKNFDEENIWQCFQYGGYMRLPDGKW